MDALLVFLHSAKEPEREQRLSDLILVHASPLVRRTLRQRLGFYVNQFGVNPHNQDAEDLYHEIVTKLIGALNEPETAAGRKNVIKDFRQYVLRVSANACHDYIRAKSPARARLKSNLRDLLERHPDFSLWRSGESVVLCGFAVWIGDSQPTPTPSSAERITDLLEDPRTFLSVRFPQNDVHNVPLTKMSAELFAWIGQPIEFEQLVGLIANLLHVKDTPHIRLEDQSEILLAEHSSIPSFRSESQAEARDLLRLIWAVVQTMPEKQRDTFCMGFVDENGDDLFTLLVTEGVATLEQLAMALDRPLNELMRLWQHMPMDNQTLAHELGAARRQVNKWRFRALQRLRQELLAALQGK